MNTDENITFQFNQSLGQLFYAVASADNTVRDEEVIGTEKLIKNYWPPKESSITNSKNTIVNTFTNLCKDKERSAEDCYNSFIDFKKQNEFIFTDQIRMLILKTAREIAVSFSGINKSELILLGTLNIELKKGSL
ncbi:hypothetical protein ES676_11370 [Bizionia saleffrena]|uniref:TerB family tellurite resistance protein n=1 Tax=Bizionia saleffrena TaxID=291189 RepID=A0A8H2LD59_9FLAO|nr:hypothetical protein [Bizionia saleffrena]TYB72559.1 hypothetical protein ES676_11370 [Bizionia saleffrena]